MINSRGRGVKLRAVCNAKKIISTTNISIHLIIRLWLHQIVLAFCYFTINDFILNYFFSKSKSLYSKISSNFKVNRKWKNEKCFILNSIKLRNGAFIFSWSFVIRKLTRNATCCKNCDNLLHLCFMQYFRRPIYNSLNLGQISVIELLLRK